MNSKPEEDEQEVIICPKCGRTTRLNKQNLAAIYPICPYCEVACVPLDTRKEPETGDATAKKRE